MFSGKVIYGDGVGKQLGFHTANLDINVVNIGLNAGVYAATAFLNKKKYQAALAIQKKLGKVEVHLLNYHGPDFYGEELRVEVGGKVSELYEFTNQDELIKKIGRDIKKVLKIFNSPNSPNF